MPVLGPKATFLSYTIDMLGSRRNTLVLLSLTGGCVLLFSKPAASQQAQPGFPSVPASELRKAKLEKVEKQQVFGKDKLEAALPSTAEVNILREGGVGELRVDRYRSSGGVIRSEIAVMYDPKAAYSGFTYWRPQQARPVGLGDGAVETPGQLLFWQADFLVRLSYPQDGKDIRSQALTLAEAISRSIGEHQETPPLAQFLPSSGRVPGSERYVLGNEGLRRLLQSVQSDFLGFKDSIEIATTDYAIGQDSARLLLVGYPTMALARQYYGTLNPHLQEMDLNGQGYFTKRSGALIAILIGNLSIESAKQMLDKIEYSYSVKWIYRKGPSQTLTSESVSLLSAYVASIFLTGIFCLVSVAGGLMLGGSRYLLRVLVPNNFLDKPERVELLRLNLYH